MSVNLTIELHTADGPRPVTVEGRMAWALAELIKAGARGCTPIDNPAPRWSHYVWKLRGLGIAIETIHEPHGGPFAGTHARYRLIDEVRVISSAEGRAAA